MKTLSRASLVSLAALAFAAPAPALAAAQITEIMYNLPGSNAGRQWLEVVNTGPEAVNLAGYKLFENGTNHALKLAAGSDTLAAGSAAILAQDPQDFRADHANFSGTIFKSAFTLTIKGETLALKNSSGAVVDSVSYTSALGGNGDGNSLHRDGSSFVPGPPSPGVYPDPKMPPVKSTGNVAAAKQPIHYTGTAAKANSVPAAQSPSRPASVASQKIDSSAPASVVKGSQEAAAAAAPPAGIATASLAEIVAGSAAFGVVILAGLLLSHGNVRLRRQEASATESAADEFEIIDNPPHA